MRHTLRRALESSRSHYDSGIIYMLAIIIAMGLIVYAIRKVIMFVLARCGVIEKSDGYIDDT